VFAVVLGVLNLAATGWSTVAWFVGGGLLLTGVAGYCPVYDLLGYSTLDSGDHDPDHW